MSVTGTVFDIQPFSTHDGPGIRTTVFLKGCNNRCAWCHNPESLTAEPQLRYYESKCIGCGRCAEVCEHGCFDSGEFDFSKCVSCGKCAAVCPTGAREMCGKVMTPQEVFEAVAKDAPFFRNSGGGVTFSGGEPLLQADFVAEAAKLCKEAGFSVGIQTALNVPYENVRKVLPYMDFFMVDYKHCDDEMHKKFIGISHMRILDNLHRLGTENTKLIVRTLIVPGVTDGEETIDRIAADVATLPNLDSYVLLKYHNFGMGKIESMGGCDEVREFTPPTTETMDNLVKVAKRYINNVKHN